MTVHLLFYLLLSGFCTLLYLSRGMVQVLEQIVVQVVETF